MKRFLAYLFCLLACVSAVCLLLRPVPILLSIAGVVVFALLARRFWPKSKAQTGSGRERLFAAIMVFFTLAVCGFLLLLGLPIVFSRLPQPMGIYGAHPEYYWTLEPNTSGIRGVPMNDGSNYEWNVAISEQGFADESVPDNKGNELRVLLLGDSFAMGWGLEREDTISEQLESRLADGLNKEVRVVNGGVIGYSPWQSYGFLMERGFAIDPDLVILQTFPGNDVEGSLEKVGEHLESFDPEWKRNVDLRIARQQWQVQLQTWVLWNVPGWRSFESAVGSQNILVDVLNSIRIFKPFELREYPAPADRLFYLEPMLVESYPELEHGWDLFTDSVGAIASECESRNVPFMAFAIPEAAAVTDSLWQKEVIEPGDEALYERGADAKRAEEVFQDLDVRYVPMAESMPLEADRENFYLHLDRHFAPAGAAWVAEQIAGKIIEEEILVP